jgi:hypothetical protein
MPEDQLAGELAGNEVDGWIVDDVSSYQHLVRNDPPRPGCFLRILKEDLRDPRVLKYWGSGLGLAVGGAVGVCFGVGTGWPWLGLPALAAPLFGGRWLNLGRFGIVAVSGLWFWLGVERLWLGVLGMVVSLVGFRQMYIMLDGFRRALRMQRHGPLVLGAVHSLGKRSFVRDYSDCQAVLSDGRSISVRLKTAPLAALHGWAEVLVLVDTRDEHGYVVGVRALAKKPVPIEVGESEQ